MNQKKNLFPPAGTRVYTCAGTGHQAGIPGHDSDLLQDAQGGLWAAWRRSTMHRFTAILTILIMAIVLTVATGSAQQPAHNMSNAGPYKVLKTARVGGEGNWDYIYA